ncbi:MAG: RiPP maturation radical SAM C-methyltransferase [Deltaproteobacteria bacterium]|nr:RiPP maturation radical SAM C-methyltransferase [Deltaproteobacteria bacterium]
MMDVALISTPWPLFNRPSIQLGTLKAYVAEQLPEVRVKTYHAYLRVALGLGYELYAPISERTWLSESPYALLLYPELEEKITSFWHRQARRVPELRGVEFKDLCARIREISDRVIEEIAREKFKLAGISICFGQLTSAIYFLRRIKEQSPDTKILVGGSSCAGPMGASLIHAIPEIDFVIGGEGELPVMYLIRWLISSGGRGDPDPVPGLATRANKDPENLESFSQIADLDQIPIPDYDDYFSVLGRFPPRKVFIPKLPVEISRGCYWRGRDFTHRARGCAFCNLNLQWQGYRSKSRERVLRELAFLSKRYQSLSLSFMDNLMPPGNLEELFRAIADLGRDFRLFAEVRSTLSREELLAMGKAGVREIQVGIEALSTSLLRKMAKGTRAIENLEIMKNCEARGTPNLEANLILEFPGSDTQDVNETLGTLDFAYPFRPLKGIKFWLGYGSPVWKDPGSYGIKKHYNHPRYRHLFPRDVLKKLILMHQGYYGCNRQQRRLWQGVRDKIEEWRNFYRALHEQPESDPILFYTDGGDFMIIRHRRHGQHDMNHRLKGKSREIYLFCERRASISSILARFPGLGEEKVIPFLRMMVEKRLMFNEGEEYLSLAVPLKGLQETVRT